MCCDLGGYSGDTFQRTGQRDRHSCDTADSPASSLSAIMRLNGRFLYSFTYHDVTAEPFRRPGGQGRALKQLWAICQYLTSVVPHSHEERD